MTITVTLPEDIVQHADPAREALEALVIEGYRKGALSSYQSRSILNLDRFEFDAFLNQHEVWEWAYDVEDLAKDLANMESLVIKK